MNNKPNTCLWTSNYY